MSNPNDISRKAIAAAFLMTALLIAATILLSAQ